ncbi:MAG: hypothetical protein RIB59_16830 [Rhodospirillales bacterium]
MARTERKTAFENILRNPAREYGSPSDVLRDDDLSDNQKLQVLQSWEFDARELAVAEDENMTGGEDDKLFLVRQAMNALSDKMGIELANENTIPTGQGVHTRTIQPKPPEHLTNDEMRQGVTSGRVRAVLFVSTLLAVAAMIVVYTLLT